MSRKILHVLYNDKFIVPYIDFIRKNNIGNDHTFLYYGGSSEEIFPFSDGKHIDVLYDEKGKFNKLKYSIKYFHAAEKIILHGFFNQSLVRFLYLQPWLLKKCYWVMWGGDLYYHRLGKENPDYKQHEKIRKKVISKIGHFITYLKGDYRLVQKWYGAKGKYHECLMYPSNIYKEHEMKPKKSGTINIQVGNSADPTNNHFEIFKKIEIYQNQNIKIIVPLSYGNQKYARKVIEKGRIIFGNKFEPLTEYMPFKMYMNFLAEVDVAIFAHNRQQAMGNIITLLGLGKKVYMKDTISPWELFIDKKIKLYNVDRLDIFPINIATKKSNQKNVKAYFSEENLLSQWKSIFKE